MPQMVLPQTPAPGMQNDANPVKSGSTRESDGESRYEAVSRAEQKRLDRQQSERPEERRAKESARAEDQPRNSDKADQPNGQSRVDSELGAAKAEKAGSSEDGEAIAAETAGELEEVSAPLTFAELQALLVPANPAGNPAATSVAAGTNGASSALAAMMPGQGGSAGAVAGKPGQGQTAAPGMTAGLQLTEALASTLGSETARPADPTNLIASGRFQSALEVAGQQAASANAAKVPTEAAVPLRSYATSIDIPVGQAEWGDKVVGKLSWLTARNMSVAEIHLTPPDMGPMEVKVRVQNEQANITVHAANPVVRDQLEQNAHRLRDMLGEQGLNLSRFDVSDSPQQRSGEQGPGEGQDGGAGGRSESAGLAEVDDAEAQAAQLDLSWKGEVDVFA